MKGFTKVVLAVLVVLASVCTSQKYSDIFPENSQYGYIQVGAQPDSQMFYWFFESRSNPDKDPLLVWLNGGPGCSSLIGLFFENGPFEIKNNGDTKATLKSIAWNQKANVIFLEQPLGVGFSNANPKDEPQNMEDMQEHFWQFIVKWIHLPQFDKYRKRPLYISGESYGGHWVPYISAKLYHEDNPDINFRGLAIGNGWMSPTKTYLNYGNFASQHPEQTGFTPADNVKLQPVANLCQFMIPQNNPLFTYDRSQVCEGINSAIITDPATGKPKFNYYNINMKTDYPEYYTAFLNRQDVQTVLGVNKKWYDCNGNVYGTYFKHDWFKDSTLLMKQFLNDPTIKVLWYNGDLDYICNWLGEEDAINHISWSKSFEWSLLKWQKCPYGLCKTLGHVKFIKFHNAGHMVPTEQIALSTQMINDFMGV